MERTEGIDAITSKLNRVYISTARWRARRRELESKAKTIQPIIDILPNDALEKIASLTDATTTFRLMSTCTAMKTENMKNIADALARKVTKEVLVKIVQRLNDLETFWSNPVVCRNFIRAYLKYAIKHPTNGTSCIWGITMQLANQLHCTPPEIRSILTVLANRSSSSIGVHPILEEFPTAYDIVKNFVLGQKTCYALKLSNQHIELRMDVWFEKQGDNVTPKMRVLHYNFNKPPIGSRRQYETSENMVTQILIENPDLLHEEEDHELKQDVPKTIVWTSERVSPLQQKYIPSATMTNKTEIEFYVTHENLDGLVNMIHQDFGNGVFIGNMTPTIRCRPQVTNADGKPYHGSSTFINSVLRKVKNKYMSLCLNGLDKSINVKMCYTVL